MGFKFSENIPESIDLDAALEVLKKMASENGINFSGDTSSGSVSGKGFAGSYRMTGRTVEIQIDKKPFWAPESIIKSKIQEAIKNADKYL